MKDIYSKYCNNILAEKAEILNYGELGMLATGMQIKSLYDLDLANLLYEKGRETGNFDTCLIILNSRYYPTDIEKLKELMREFKNEMFFRLNPNYSSTKMLNNFDSLFLMDLYDQVMSEEVKKDCLAPTFVPAVAVIESSKSTYSNDLKNKTKKINSKKTDQEREL